MRTHTSIRMVCAKTNIQEQKNDFAYWQTQPYSVRLATLEEIRQEFHRWKYGAVPRLQ
jgi:predicted deacetylase